MILEAGFAAEAHGDRSSGVDADVEDACAVEGLVYFEQLFEESFEEGDIVVLAEIVGVDDKCRADERRGAKPREARDAFVGSARAVQDVTTGMACDRWIGWVSR